MSAGGDNIALDAIRALQYEGTRAEIARGFKEQGNEMVEQKLWRDAKEFYTKGIAVLTGKEPDVWEKGEDPREEMEREKILEEQIFVNRALCHLELSMHVGRIAWLVLILRKRTTGQRPPIVPPRCRSTRITSKHTIALLVRSPH